MKIPRTTEDYTVWRYQETGPHKTKSRSGRPKETTRAEDNFITVTSLRHRRLTASNIPVQLNQCHAKNVSISIIRRKLNEAGLYGRIAFKRPLLRKQNNVKRLQRAKAHKDLTIEQWNKVLWIDKSKFEIFRSNRRVYVQRRVGERVATPCITSTVKHGGGCVRSVYQLQSQWYAPCKG